MTARIVRIAGTLTTMVSVLLADCGSNGSGSEDRRTATVEVARQYQQAMLDKEWKVACEMRTERLRGGTVAACIKETDVPRLNEYPDARVRTGEPFEIEASGAHEAGVGLRVSVSLDPTTGLRIDSALRLVPGGAKVWLVDQAVNLDEFTRKDQESVRAALRRR